MAGSRKRKHSDGSNDSTGDQLSLTSGLGFAVVRSGFGSQQRRKLTPTIQSKTALEEYELAAATALEQMRKLSPKLSVSAGSGSLSVPKKEQEEKKSVHREIYELYSDAPSDNSDITAMPSPPPAPIKDMRNAPSHNRSGRIEMPNGNGELDLSFYKLEADGREYHYNADYNKYLASHSINGWDHEDTLEGFRPAHQRKRPLVMGGMKHSLIFRCLVLKPDSSDVTLHAAEDTHINNGKSPKAQ